MLCVLHMGKEGQLESCSSHVGESLLPCTARELDYQEVTDFHRKEKNYSDYFNSLSLQGQRGIAAIFQVISQENYTFIY